MAGPDLVMSLMASSSYGFTESGWYRALSAAAPRGRLSRAQVPWWVALGISRRQLEVSTVRVLPVGRVRVEDVQLE